MRSMLGVMQPSRAPSYAIDLGRASRADTALVGGKAAALGELRGVDGITVPPGFCVTTDAFRRAVTAEPGIGPVLDRLTAADPDDRVAVRALSAEVRRLVLDAPLPDGLAAAVVRAVGDRGAGTTWAVRSSATAEDQPTTSSAGLHDTELGVRGAAAVLAAVRRCWASLHTERAVAYRRRHGIDERSVRMAVVVQRLVAAEVSGVLFTADPVTSNRTLAVVEAVAGRGDAFVAGRAEAETATVRDGRVVDRTVPPGGSDPSLLLDDGQVVELAALGRRIEARLGRPQDVEWCLAGGRFHVVQSRPITTLFPVPSAHDGDRHVYVSVGHQQMMTDAMRPLGWSVHQLVAARPMVEAGGRLFVDVAPTLSSPATRGALLDGFGRSDPLIADALRTIVERGDLAADGVDGVEPPPGPAPAGTVPADIETDAALVEELVERTATSVAATRARIEAVSGPACFDAIRADIDELRRSLFEPQSHQAVMAGMQAAWWIDDRVEAWLGERQASHALTRSAPGNVTSEMGLALLDVADAVRPHPEVIAFLEAVEAEGRRAGPSTAGPRSPAAGPADPARHGRFLDDLEALPGGPAVRAALDAWLERYGMRCPGEIDLTTTRWVERPAMLAPLLLGHVRNLEPGDAERRFARGRREAAAARRELLDRLRALPDGAAKAAETERMIERLRTFIGYREHPKYGMVGRYLVYKRALLAEAERLAGAGALEEAEDCFFLTFDELEAAVRTNRVEEGLVAQRREEHRGNRALSPPRVMTSDGEVVVGRYRGREVPAGALTGLAVSAGTVEGRARVVLDPAVADLEPGDVLVTPHTDPSWTPLFVTAAGLVTEVGGLMTHGAVIAREYGLPALVGVEHATTAIRDGQPVRLDATDGYVEVLAPPPAPPPGSEDGVGPCG